MGGGSASRPNTTNPNDAGSETSSFTGGSSTSQSSSFQDPQSVWGGQSPYLTSLYGGGQNLGMGTQGQGQAQGVYDDAMTGFNRMMNPGVNPQLQAYSGDVQRNLDRNLLPSIQGTAQMQGQGGSSRQGIAEGLAISDSNQQITDMASNLYNADMNRMGQAMSMAPSLGTFGQQIPWYNMNQYSGLLGDPTVLGGASGSQSTGMSSSFGGSSGSSYDIGGGTDDQGWNVSGYYGVGG